MEHPQESFKFAEIEADAADMSSIDSSVFAQAGQHFGIGHVGYRTSETTSTGAVVNQADTNKGQRQTFSDFTFHTDVDF